MGSEGQGAGSGSGPGDPLSLQARERRGPGEVDEGRSGVPPADDGHLLETLRQRISELDDRLILLIGERKSLVLEIGRVKEAMGLPVLDPRREAEVVRRAAARARELGVDEEMTRDVVWRIMAAARAEQEGRLPGWPERRPPPSAADS